MDTLATEILACCGSALSNMARGGCVPISFANLLYGVGTDPEAILNGPGDGWDDSMRILLEMARVRPRAMTRNELFAKTIAGLSDDNVQVRIVRKYVKFL